MPNKESGISCGWLESEAYAANFADLHPPISKTEAKVEAQRCYYCYDAPCIKACPTEINIPSFISRIADDNILGAAHQILSANILGGSCARVCPVESLCEGPACAHALALLGYNVVIHEAKDKGGGSTAIDVAMECRRLGSRRVVLAYRRGEKDMSATPVEISQARNDGVEVVPWVRPLRWMEKDGQLRGIVHERTQLDTHGKLVSTGETWELDADMAFTAIGQLQLPKALGDKAEALFSAPSSAQSSKQAACIVTHESFETQFPGVFAGGDCINGGGLTVQAVAHGKKAAQKIDIYLNQGE